MENWRVVDRRLPTIAIILPSYCHHIVIILSSYCHHDQWGFTVVTCFFTSSTVFKHVVQDRFLHVPFRDPLAIADYSYHSHHRISLVNFASDRSHGTIFQSSVGLGLAKSHLPWTAPEWSRVRFAWSLDPNLSKLDPTWGCRRISEVNLDFIESCDRFIDSY